MKVTLATHGGQAAAIRLRLPAKVLDTRTLSTNTAAELTELVAAVVPTAARERPRGQARDAMSYTITLEDESHTTVLTQSDTTMSPEFASLLGWLERYFAQQ